MICVWRWLRQWLPWSVVRIFGSLTYFNISYGVLLLVPIVHELYARAVPIMRWFGAPGEFPVTLQWLYAASLIYAAAILLYQIFCPSEVNAIVTRRITSELNTKSFNALIPNIAWLSSLLDCIP